MKKYVPLTLLIAIPLLALAGNNYYQTRLYKSQKAAPNPQREKEVQLRLAVINIGGFGCPSCPIIAENALKDTKGVLDARTTSTGEASRVLYDASVISIESIQKVLSPAGYTVDKIITDQPTQTNKLD